MEPQQIRVTIQGPIAEIVLCRPEVRNAMTERMGEELAAAVVALGSEEGLRAVIVRGEGGHFSGGGDLGFIDARTAAEPEDNRRAMGVFYRRFLSIRDLPVPTIAAIEGAAVGAGMCFAMACDLRVAAEDSKLGLNFTRVGLHPGMGATFLLPRLVGPARAAEILFTGRILDAARALEMGLVNAIHPKGMVLEAARALALEIASAAPLAVARTKSTLRFSLEHTLEQALESEARSQALDYRTEDVKEAVAAFRGKRSANFRGR